MSLLLSCCSQNLEKDENINANNEKNYKSGKERILRLNHKENFSENIKYFISPENNNIYNNEISQDIFNLTPQNKLFNFSNLCLFCGGTECTSENYIKEKSSVIKGLISDIFYDCIIVSQRPSTALIKQHNLIKSFKANNIKLIVNCQIHGEHPKCGPNKGLETDSGYTYSPSCFIEEDIDYLNCGFQESECPPTLDFMLDIVKKISYCIEYNKGKVLVHGHSPYGRSCLVTACFAIFYFNKTADDNINDIRKKWIDAINNNQEEFCRKFEIYMDMLKNIFPKRKISIDKFIKYQNDINYDFNKIDMPNIISDFFKDNYIDEYDLSEIININYVPKILVKCLDKIIFLKNKLNIKDEQLYHLLNDKNEISKNDINKIALIKNELSQNIWNEFNKNKNLLIIIKILYHWLSSNIINCINPEKIEKIYKNEIIAEIFKSNCKYDYIAIYELIKEFKLIFSKAEYETIKYISIFISSIYCKTKDEQHIISEEMTEFKKFLYKISLLLLGYSLNKTDDPLIPSESKEILMAKNFMFILEFFIFYSTNKEIKTKIENDNSDWLDDYLNMKKRFDEKNTNDVNKEENDILLFLKYKPKVNFVSIKSFL